MPLLPAGFPVGPTGPPNSSGTQYVATNAISDFKWDPNLDYANWADVVQNLLDNNTNAITAKDVRDPLWTLWNLVGFALDQVASVPTGVTGSQGFQGSLGFQGNQGFQGRQGVQGNQGRQGSQGLIGLQGVQGNQGNQGLVGVQGNQGNQGFQGLSQTGSQGLQGLQGLQGWQGIVGFQGNQGNQGYQGPIGLPGVGVRGFQGNQGFQGLQGLLGDTGSQGFQGNQGNQGSQGIQGDTGYQGFQGDTGVQGFQGNQGPQGSQGIAGSFAGIGDTGFQGFQGWQGWQGFQGVQGFQGRQGIQGDTGVQGFQGNQGSQGSQGIAGSFAGIGDTGFQGFQGNQGNQGNQGIAGSFAGIGDTGVQGFQGFQGNQGNQGSQGIAGSFAGTGDTGFQGFQGNQGYQGYTGPQGFQGLQGLQGYTGIQGFQGFQGNQGNQGNQGIAGSFAGIGDTGVQGFQGFQGNQGNQGSQGIAGSFAGTGDTGFQGFQGPTGPSQVLTGRQIWVDSVYGDNTTGTPDRFDLPYLGLTAAQIAATSGDVINVRPGTYVTTGKLGKHLVDWSLGEGVIIICTQSSPVDGYNWLFGDYDLESATFSPMSYNVSGFASLISPANGSGITNSTIYIRNIASELHFNDTYIKLNTELPLNNNLASGNPIILDAIPDQVLQWRRDDSFNSGVGLSAGSISSILYDQNSDRIYIGGQFDYYNDSFIGFNSNPSAADGGGYLTSSSITHPRIIRSFIDGSRDFSFNEVLDQFKFIKHGVSGYISDSPIAEFDTSNPQYKEDNGAGISIIRPVENNSIIFSVSSQQHRALHKFNSNDQRDPTFRHRQSSVFNRIQTAHLLEVGSDGNYLLGGSMNSDPGTDVFKLDSDGNIITQLLNISPSTILSTYDYIVGGIRSDGRAVILGAFTQSITLSWISSKIIEVDYNSPYSITRQFNSISPIDGFGPQNSVIRCAKILSDDSMIIGGTFSTFDGVSVPPNLIKLDSDYTINSTFSANLGTGFDGIVECIEIDNQGNILVGGRFTSFNGNLNCRRLVRLDSDGNLIDDFNSLGSSSGSFNNTVRAIEIQPDNRILVGGDFTTFNGESVRGIIRLGRSTSIYLHQCIVESFAERESVVSLSTDLTSVVYSYNTHIDNGYSGVYIYGNITTDMLESVPYLQIRNMEMARPQDVQILVRDTDRKVRYINTEDLLSGTFSSGGSGSQGSQGFQGPSSGGVGLQGLQGPIGSGGIDANVYTWRMDNNTGLTPSVQGFFSVFYSGCPSTITTGFNYSSITTIKIQDTSANSVNLTQFLDKANVGSVLYFRRPDQDSPNVKEWYFNITSKTFVPSGGGYLQHYNLGVSMIGSPTTPINDFQTGSASTDYYVGFDFIGAIGVTGVQGLQGFQGIQGSQGRQGLSGNTGVQGFQGLSGNTGVQGFQGLSGNTGVQGSQGLSGNTGVQGSQGLSGNTGVQGFQGSGNTGVQGFQGLSGNTGVQGFQGQQGISGTNGAGGSQGFQGPPSTALISSHSGYFVPVEADLYVGGTSSGWSSGFWDYTLASSSTTIEVEYINCAVPIPIDIPADANISICGIAYTLMSGKDLNNMVWIVSCDSVNNDIELMNIIPLTSYQFEANSTVCFSDSFNVPAVLRACNTYIVVGFGADIDALNTIKFSYTLRIEF